jgi:hypothetical protein
MATATGAALVFEPGAEFGFLPRRRVLTKLPMEYEQLEAVRDAGGSVGTCVGQQAPPVAVQVASRSAR